MLKHLEYVEPKQSPYRRVLASEWDHRQYLHIRKGMKRLGHALAVSGAMKNPVRNISDVIDIVTNCSHALGSHHRIILRTLLPEWAVDCLNTWDSRWLRAPWANEDWFVNSPYRYTHCLHMSEKVEGNVAFAENLDKLKVDRFTSCKPGRYLQRFFGDRISEGDIKYWAEKVQAMFVKATLKFIENNDKGGWVRVYADGPDSCMKGCDAVKIYAHEKSVLRLAYLETDDGSIVARAIVREDDMAYIRVYPNTTSCENQRWHTLMVDKLKDAGYSHGSLEGVRLERIVHRDRFVMPYLDGSVTNITDRGNYLEVTECGIDAQNTNGYIDMYDQRCDDCDGSMSEDEACYIEVTDRTVCECCRDQNYTYAMGRRYEDYFPNEDVIHCRSDGVDYLADTAHYHDVYECSVRGNWYHIEDLVTIDDEWVHVDEAVHLDEPHDDNDYALNGGTVETHDGRTIHREDAVEHGGKTYYKDDEIEVEDETEEVV